LVADLLAHVTYSIATTRPDRIGFPKRHINKGSVAGDNRGIAASTILDGKVHCFVWLNNKPVFFVDTCYDFTQCVTVPRTLQNESKIQVTEVSTWQIK